jgi:predicted secreted protein
MPQGLGACHWLRGLCGRGSDTWRSSQVGEDKLKCYSCYKERYIQVAGSMYNRNVVYSLDILILICNN